MTDKVTMYPTKVSQPNRNKASGLQGKCFKAVRRSGSSYEVNCRDQKDPKYHHEWSDAEEILKGKTIQCGRPSTKMCSHATYYGIAGYRNTCPIAGVTGTYTQPATLRVFFNLSKKGISSSAKINKVEISFEHRCTGVDVSNGKESTSWGPNFDGAKIYPSRKPLTVKIGSEKKSSGKNPPLSNKFSGTGNFTFTNVTYKNLVEHGVDIIYGNNLETNPGNIYLRNLKATIYYDDGSEYITGSQSSDSLYVSDAQSCKTSINFTIEAGYKQGSTKVPVNKAPKNLRDFIICSNSSASIKNHPTDSRKKIYTVYENTPGQKTITFSVKGTNKKISFDYTAIKRNKPNIKVPTQIERNVDDDSVVDIIAENGCANKITVYKEGVNTDPFYTFTNLEISNQSNIIPLEQAKDFYQQIANLPCKKYKFIFKRDNEPNEEAIIKYIDIVPTKHSFKFVDKNNEEIDKISFDQNKKENKTVKLVFEKTKNLLNTPNFKITNPTHGKIVDDKPTKKVIDDIIWGDTNKGADVSLNKEGDSINIPVGTYYPGDYSISVEEEACPGNPSDIKVNIVPNHRQYFDEIFVRGEDSTAFDYDYLVALEGDTIAEPIRVNTIELASSFNDISICSEKEKISGLTEINSIDLTISNNSENHIQNLMLELNPIILDDDEETMHASSQEWLNDEGIFYNFIENFDNFNKNYSDIVSVKNLTLDDDNVDEENVYIHINQLRPGEEIPLKIPFSCFKEKYVLLQILLFGEPVLLYEKGFCNSEEKRFDKIKLRVYDSIATNMDIIGETDLFSTEIIDKCPQECFTTKMEYLIRNTDMNNAEPFLKTKIYNDPRLVPYKFEYKGNEFTIEENVSSRISFYFGPSFKEHIISGAKIDAYIKFENHVETHLTQYTDYNGETIFYINIPQTVSKSYSIEDLLEIMSIEYEGGILYNSFKKTGDNYLGEERILPSSQNKNNTKITIFENKMVYKAGQVIPIRVKIEGEVTYIQNEIDFSPDITNPGDKDSLIVYYKICNLENREGKLSTKFVTEDYRLIPNEISKNIYCGMDTNIKIFTRITKTVVENNTINRLHLSLSNKNRDNKNVKVLIKEINPIEKYDIIDSELDKGTLSIQDGNLLWIIDYIEEDTTINGYIDLKAKKVGCSSIGVYVKDFIDDLSPKPNFGKEFYECPCNKKVNE